MNIQDEDNKNIITDKSLEVGRRVALRSRFFAFLAIIVLILGTFFISSYVIEDERLELEAHLKQQIEIMTLERSDVLSAWLSGILKQSKSITQNDVFRLYSMEKDKDEEISPEYVEQLPFMINALTGFVQDSDYSAAYVLGRDGETYLTSMDARPLENEQKLEALRLFDNGQASFSIVRERSQGLEFDLFVPVFPVDVEHSSNKIVSVFVFSIPVNENLKVLLHEKTAGILEGGYSLFQKTFDANIQEVRLFNGEAILDVEIPGSVFSGSVLEFAKRPDFRSDKHVYSFGASLQNTPFYLVWQTPEAVARDKIDKFVINTYLVAVFFVLSLVTAVGAFWWRSNSGYNQALADQYANFANKLGKQKKILDSINNTIKELITFKDKYGNYVYVNPAFSEAVGIPVEGILGFDATTVLGHGTGMKLEKLDDLVLASKEPVSVIDELYLKGEKRHLQISKVPLLATGDDGEDEDSIVTVARDITDFVEEQERREKSVRQTVLALIRAVELRDPHLAGHSKRVSELASLVANEIKPDPRLRRTVDIAAMLSQIGKLDIPSEILTADRRLTDDEIKIMNGHVENAEKIISDIDFDVPVLEAISHMYERLDGSGYPRKLHDYEISLEGRILGVCDYFCARIEPRSYRQAILPKDAIKFLEQSPQKYDPQVVSALKAAIKTTVGERIIASIASSF